MAINTSPGAGSDEIQNKVHEQAEKEKHLTKNQQWERDQHFSNTTGEAEQNADPGDGPTDPQIFGESGAGKD